MSQFQLGGKASVKELGDDKDHARSGCPHTACMPKIIKTAHERVRRNPKMIDQKNASRDEIVVQKL